MEALGPLLILVSIPLIMRWVPQNRFYGLRIPATRRDKSVWYDANARSARHLFAFGLFLVLLEFVLPATMRVQVLRVVATVGFAVIIVIDWRAANRMARQRRGVS